MWTTTIKQLLKLDAFYPTWHPLKILWKQFSWSSFDDFRYFIFVFHFQHITWLEEIALAQLKSIILWWIKSACQVLFAIVVKHLKHHIVVFSSYFQKVIAEDFCAFVIDISVIVPLLSSSLRLPWLFLSFGLLWILSFHHSYQCPWQKHYGHQESTQPEHGNDFPCVGFHIFPSTQNCSTNVKAKINLPLLK